MADVKEIKNEEIKNEDIEAAKEKAADVTVVELKRPLNYNDESFEKLEFDFDAMTGADALAVNKELAQLGLTAFVPAGSDEFMIRLAARACKQDIGSDAFESLTLKDYLKIIAKVRGFLLRSE